MMGMSLKTRALHICKWPVRGLDVGRLLVVGDVRSLERNEVIWVPPVALRALRLTWSIKLHFSHASHPFHYPYSCRTRLEPSFYSVTFPALPCFQILPGNPEWRVWFLCSCVILPSPRCSVQTCVVVVGSAHIEIPCRPPETNSGQIFMYPLLFVLYGE